MQQKPPVILQIIPSLGPGGAEQGCIDVASAICKAGGTALVVSHQGARIHELTRVGAKHIDMPMHSKNIFTMIFNIRRIRALIRDYKIDIVHVRSRAPAWSAFMAVRGTQAQFITTCHAPYKFKNRFKKIYNSIMTKGARVIAISDFVAHYLKANYMIDEKLIRTIQRGIPIEKFHPANVTPERMIKLSNTWRIPEGMHVIMLPGRLTRWKGHHIFIDALSQLDRTDVFGLIIGSDQGRTDYTKELHNLITKKNLDGRVRIVEHCADMPAAYMLAEIIVSASIEPEGFGRIPVEAQAMGRSIIATAHGGARETITDGETGWLVPPYNPKALADKIQDVLNMSQEIKEHIALRAIENASVRFSKDRMTADTLRVYNELLVEKLLRIPDNPRSFQFTA